MLLRALLCLFTVASAFSARAGSDPGALAAYRFIDRAGALRWQARGTAPLVLTWAVADQVAEFPGAENCPRLTPLAEIGHRSRLSGPAIEGELRTAFAMWEAASNVRFEQTSETHGADIVVGAQGDPEGYAFADVRFGDAEGGVPGILRSLICLNPLKAWKIGFGGDPRVYDLRYTFAHEIGHALGLDHPERSGEIMSMRYSEDIKSLQAGDVAGVQALYGPPVPTVAAEDAKSAATMVTAPDVPVPAQSRALSAR